MNAPTEVQTIRGRNGVPLYAVLPFAEYEALVSRARGRVPGSRSTLPHEVVVAMVEGASAARAWREHLGLTQAAVARRMGISQAALAQMEKGQRPRKATRTKLAAALGIRTEQLVTR